MNIRKIIREEMDDDIKDSNEEDWDWANGINPYENVEVVKELLSSGDELQILNRCDCTLGGKTEKMVGVSFLEYFKHVHNNTFIAIELGNDMGVLDMSIDAGQVNILHFNTPKEWQQHFNGLELSRHAEVGSSMFSELKKRIPEVINAYQDSI